MALSKNQVTHRCLAGGGAKQCRYLTSSYNRTSGTMVHECQKLLKGTKKKIDDTVQKHIDDCKKNHVDPNQQYRAIGSGGSCPGYLYLPTLMQGYDQPKKP